MTRKSSSWILIGLSVLYGLTIAVLDALDIPVGVVAIVGAVVLGALWIVRGLAFRRT